jgi:hypothetical protein
MAGLSGVTMVTLFLLVAQLWIDSRALEVSQIL